MVTNPTAHRTAERPSAAQRRAESAEAHQHQRPGRRLGTPPVREMLSRAAIGGRPFGVPADRNFKVSVVAVAVKLRVVVIQPPKPPGPPVALRSLPPIATYAAGRRVHGNKKKRPPEWKEIVGRRQLSTSPSEQRLTIYHHFRGCFQGIHCMNREVRVQECSPGTPALPTAPTQRWQGAAAGHAKLKRGPMRRSAAEQYRTSALKGRVCSDRSSRCPH